MWAHLTSGYMLYYIDRIDTALPSGVIQLKDARRGSHRERFSNRVGKGSFPVDAGLAGSAT